jgi:hypothetical protein
MNPSARFPEGIDQRHIHQAMLLAHRWPLGLIALGILLVAALSGVFGTEARWTVSGHGLDAVLAGPLRIRNGEVFEMRVTVSARRDIRDLVLRIDRDIWHDVTVNTFIPAAIEERFRNDAFEFHFGALRTGASLLVKIDGQINPSHPPARNDGRITLADGATVLATVAYTMDVFP